MWPEPLHQLLIGLMARAIGMVVQRIEERSGEHGKALFDSMIKSLEPRRQSERHAFPISSFPRGLTNLSKVFGQEWPAALLQAMAVLAADQCGRVLPRDEAFRIIRALEALYRVWQWLEAEAVVREDAIGGRFRACVERCVPSVACYLVDQGLSPASLRAACCPRACACAGPRTSTRRPLRG
jgi:hypothetical protein